MQSIFKYDVERLNCYAFDPANNIKIGNEHSYLMLSFPAVSYFNYAFHVTDQPFSQDDIKNIKAFYYHQQVKKHKVVVAATCKKSNDLLKNDADYKQVTTIVKTFYKTIPSHKLSTVNDVQFIKADINNMGIFTDLYLKSFEAKNRDTGTVSKNFRALLDLPNLELFLLKHGENYVGINVLYKSATENLLAGGAILPEHRNKKFHQDGLAFRIQLSINDLKNVVAWAYKDSVSLKNMLKLKMTVQEEFNAYEYHK